MEGLTPGELTKLRLEELQSNQRSHSDRAESDNRRWVLSLGVGNGAGLLAVAGQLLSKQDEVLAAFLMPSALCFAFGVMCAGAVMPLSVRRFALTASVWSGYAIAFRRGEELSIDLDRERRNKTLYVIETCLEWISAALFAAAILYPLLVLCARYQFSGEGFFPPAG